MKSGQKSVADAVFSFVPNNVQKCAARALLLVRAFQETVRPIVEAYGREILSRHQFRIARHLVELGCNDIVILDPAKIYMLEKEDAAVFYAESHKARDASGLKVEHPEGCPKLVADNLVFDVRRAFISEMEPLTGVTYEQLCSAGVDTRNKYVELTLCLMMPYLGVARGDAPLHGAASLAIDGVFGGEKEGGIAKQCQCRQCLRDRNEGTEIAPGFFIPAEAQRIILCPICGNKRCPHATDHQLACTGSNEPGQAGSAYEVCKPDVEVTREDGGSAPNHYPKG